MQRFTLAQEEVHILLSSRFLSCECHFALVSIPFLLGVDIFYFRVCILFTRNSQSFLMQLIIGHFKYSLYKLISLESLLPLLQDDLQNASCLYQLLTSGMTFIYLVGPVTPSLTGEICVCPCVFSAILFLFSDAEIRWYFRFYFLWQDESALECLSRNVSLPHLQYHQKNLRGIAFYCHVLCVSL